MESIAQLEENAVRYPNSIDANQALADAYAREGRWKEAIEAYQDVISLYPSIIALNVNRIRLGAIALGSSSLLFLVSEFLRPAAFMVDNPIDAAEYMMSTALALSYILFLPVLILLSCAAISIYKLLSSSSGNSVAFWAMVFIIVGAGLFIPFFSIGAIVVPAEAQLYLQGNPFLGVHEAALRQPLAIVFTLGGYLLLAGLTLFNITVWSSGYLPKWASVLFWMGWSLFIVTQRLPFVFLGGEFYSLYKPMIFAWLIAIGGIGLARGIWKQAPFQLTSTIDSQETDS